MIRCVLLLCKISYYYKRIIISEKRGQLLLFFCGVIFLSASLDLPARNRGLTKDHVYGIGTLCPTTGSDTLTSLACAADEAGLYNGTINATDASVGENDVLSESIVNSNIQSIISPAEPTSELYAYPYRRGIFDFNLQAESFSLRTNMLSWVALTPDFGIEWIINRDLGLIIDASWTSWKFGKMGYRYALWTVAPELRYYAGEEKQWFVGLYYMMGDYNFRFSDMGHQGHYMGGGISLGYAVNLSNTFALDFHVGAGVIFSDCENYKQLYGYSIRDSKEMVKYPGINKVGVTLVWKLGTNKYQRER